MFLCFLCSGAQTGGGREDSPPSLPWGLLKIVPEFVNILTFFDRNQGKISHFRGIFKGKFQNFLHSDPRKILCPLSVNPPLPLQNPGNAPALYGFSFFVTDLQTLQCLISAVFNVSLQVPDGCFSLEYLRDLIDYFQKKHAFQAVQEIV